MTHSYKNSFFNNAKVAISAARSGNVIGDVTLLMIELFQIVLGLRKITKL